MNQLRFEQTFNQLPNRRKQVLLQVLTGCSDEEIAKALNIGETTVRKHIERVAQDFGLNANGTDRRSKRSDIFALFAQYKPELLRESVFIPSDISISIPKTHQRVNTETQSIPHLSLNEAPTSFYGRTEELATLRRWILEQRCRLVTVYSWLGMGKTALSMQLFQQVREEFQVVIVRSLNSAPPLNELLADLRASISKQSDINNDNGNLNQQITNLIQDLRTTRCLIILDDVQGIMQKGQLAGYYESESENYGDFLKRVAETEHQSCLFLISQEEPIEITTMAEENSSVQSLKLLGLSLDTGQQILLDQQQLSSDNLEIISVVFNLCGGNPTVLQLISSQIRNLISGKLLTSSLQNIIYSTIEDFLKKTITTIKSRLTQPEMCLIYGLFLFQKPMLLSRASNKFFGDKSLDFISIINSLSRRSLLEINQESGKERLALNPIIQESLEYSFLGQIDQMNWSLDFQDSEKLEFLKNLNMIDESTKVDEASDSIKTASLEIANYLNQYGYKQYLKGDFTTAKYYLIWATKFQPDFVAAHFNLGSAYERLQDIPNARNHYQIAAQFNQRGSHAAISNLARLEILRGNIDTAIHLILPLLEEVQDNAVASSVHKNLGWAYYVQNSYSQAEIHLQKAIELDPQRAAAYCLLAQVQEALGQEEISLVLWKNCLQFDADDQRPEGVAWRSSELELWQAQARYRLRCEQSCSTSASS